ncbi:MAG: HAD family hydrolase [Bacteroidales bacterium]|nr:HAD family hydrolase [Bacteroidales bacterium]
MIPLCVIFDAVGTLIHPDPPGPEVYVAAAARFGVAADLPTVRERFRRAFAAEESRDAVGGWRVDEAREQERWRNIVADVLPGSPDECFRYLFDYFALPSAWHVADDAVEVIRDLMGHPITMGIASNLDARLHSILAGHPSLAPLLPHVFISSEIGFRKPHPEFYHHITHKMNCRPRQILYVGDDRQNDFDGAQNAGLRAVLFDPSGRHSDLSQRISRLTELIALFPA